MAHDPYASEAFAAAHVRRLEAMHRAGAGPERRPDGSWTVPEDHLSKAQTYALRQHRDRPVSVSVLSTKAVDRLATMDAATWLDRDLASGDPAAVRDAGFGREVRAASAIRRRWLVEQDLAQGQGRDFELRSRALERLRERELRDAAERLSGDLGKRFAPAGIGDRIEGIVARRIDLESGPPRLG